MYCRKKDSSNEVNTSILVNGELKQMQTVSCSDECADKIQEFAEFNNISSKNFVKIGIAGIIFFLFLIALNTVGFQVDIFPFIIIFFGAVFLLYPLATWGFYKRIGIKYMTIIVRVLAILLIVLGVLRLI
ncbi:hypothetical protein [Candidatus Syntrophocurvum alkaliphilum]|uniref:hypothetical protein n=1 Tax=Candidatus Syntrophocurvum alkaliphilum TaxID=2293317 RepID=UPI0012E27DC6|nr:hypothetical protein [Candidatus Syntrophocurvum alkaliphilum]